MCTKPVYIKNPYVTVFDDNLRRRKNFKPKFVTSYGNILQTTSALHSHKEYMQVPCGKCAECRNTYFNSIFQRAVVESRSSYMYFITLTYDDRHIPTVDIFGKKFHYSNYEHIQNMFKRLRKYNVIGREFRYICVNEYGDSTLRPHWHILLFVSKLDTDTDVTPYELEARLWTDIQQYYSINIGTSRKPIYERLFTYHTSYDAHGKLHANYWVQFVNVGEGVQTDTTYKTINYLIGYVNKPQRVDILLDQYLSKFSDPIFANKLRQKLSSKVRYSKGFGFGFVDGKKNYLRPTFSNLSANAKYLRELDDRLPATLDEFRKEHSVWLFQIEQSISTYDWQRYTDFRDMYMNEDIRMYSYLYIAHKYKLPCLSALRCLTPQRLTPTVRYFFEYNKGFNHTMLFPKTYEYDFSNPVYSYIRKGVDFGVKNKVPFIPFVYGDSMQPLCQFYRKCCTDQDDILKMYNACGVKNFDQWQSLFEAKINSLKAVKQKGNEISHENFVFQKINPMFVSVITPIDLLYMKI